MNKNLSVNEPRWHGWIRTGRGPIAAGIRRLGCTGLGTSAAYLGYGMVHPEMLKTMVGGDAQRRMPGDDLVGRPDQDRSFAIDVDAGPGDVWPWIVQLGYFRGGWYSWFPLDNGGYPSADDVYDSLQGLEVGDAIPDGPDGTSGYGIWRVMAMDPPRYLVLYSRRVIASGREIDDREKVDEPVIERSWSFLIEPIGELQSRLIVRVRSHLEGKPRMIARLTARIRDAGDTVMTWTVLRGIKARAEKRARARRAEIADVAWARSARIGSNGKSTRPRTRLD